MIRKRHLSISRDGWYYCVVLAFVLCGAVMRQINLLILLAGMLAGPLLLSFLLVVWNLRRLAVRRKLPRGICAGDRMLVEVELKNPRRWLGSWAVTIEDTIVRLNDSAEPVQHRVHVLFPQVAAGQTCQVAYQGRLLERGRYRFGPLRVSTRFPLGLVQFSVAVDRPEELLVCPRLGRLTRQWAEPHREDELGNRRLERRQGTLEADFFGLRDWRSGDSRRWIHWRTSARRGALVVRQFEQQRNQDLALFLDLWQPEHPAPPDLDNVELAVSFAATVLADACRSGGRRLQVTIAGSQIVELRGWTSPIFLREAMEALALAEPHGEPSLPRHLLTAIADLRPATPGLLISTRPVDQAGLRQSADGAVLSVLTRRLTTIHSGSADLERFFQID